MSSSHLLVIRAEGTLEFLYADELGILLRTGEAAIRRASHVEPTSDAHWIADLAPCGGGILGPFDSRLEALCAERAWIEARL